MSSHSLAGKFRRDPSGATMVELALRFPIKLLLTLGSIELSLYSLQSNAVSRKATQLGARWAVVNSPMSTTFANVLNSTSAWDGRTFGENCITLKSGRPVMAPATSALVVSLTAAPLS